MEVKDQSAATESKQIGQVKIADEVVAIIVDWRSTKWMAYARG